MEKGWEGGEHRKAGTGGENGVQDQQEEVIVAVKNKQKLRSRGGNEGGIAGQRRRGHKYWNAQQRRMRVMGG